MFTLDFETHKIENGSPMSPKPVGLAVKADSDEAKYYSWGHPGYNNSSLDATKTLLEYIWETGQPILCHNAKFDIRVAMEWFDLPYPARRVHDTMIMAFIHDPREESLALKDLAHKYVNMQPDEQTDLHDWILTNVKEATKKTAGAYIALAPFELVAPYAVGDVDRTFALYNFYNKINEG